MARYLSLPSSLSILTRFGQRLCASLETFPLILHLSRFPLSGGFSVGREATFQLFGDGDRLEGIAADGDENEVSFGDNLCYTFAAHFKVEAQRFRAGTPDVDGDFQKVV